MAGARTGPLQACGTVKRQLGRVSAWENADRVIEPAYQNAGRVIDPTHQLAGLSVFSRQTSATASRALEPSANVRNATPGMPSATAVSYGSL